MNKTDKSSQILLILAAFGLGVVATALFDTNSSSTAKTPETAVVETQDNACCPDGVCKVPEKE